MGTKAELQGIGDGFKAVGDAVGGLFDKSQREANKAIREAEAKAREKIAKAEAKVAEAEAKAAAKAVKAEAKQAVKAIKSGATFAAPAVEGKAWTVGRIVSKPFRIVWGGVGEVAKGVGYVAAAPFKASYKLGVGAMDMAGGVALKPVKWASSGLGKAFTRAPLLSSAVLAGTAAVSVGSWAASRNGKQLEAQSEALQQMQMAQASQPSYMNSVSADESAMLNALQKQGGQAGSKADAVMAARTQVPAPENAHIAAL